MNNTRQWLIENNLDDLILNDRDGLSPEDRVYVSDALERYGEANKNIITKTQ